jgi:hypothetical protein
MNKKDQYFEKARFPKQSHPLNQWQKVCFWRKRAQGNIHHLQNYTACNEDVRPPHHVDRRTRAYRNQHAQEALHDNDLHQNDNYNDEPETENLEIHPTQNNQQQHHRPRPYTQFLEYLESHGFYNPKDTPENRADQLAEFYESHGIYLPQPKRVIDEFTINFVKNLKAPKQRKRSRATEYNFLEHIKVPAAAPNPSAHHPPRGVRTRSQVKYDNELSELLTRGHKK